MSGCDFRHTELPFQNIGHCSHGSSLALASQVEKYGLRTVRGRTGGVRVEHVTRPNSTAAAAATDFMVDRIDEAPLVYILSRSA